MNLRGRERLTDLQFDPQDFLSFFTLKAIRDNDTILSEIRLKQFLKEKSIQRLEETFKFNFWIQFWGSFLATESLLVLLWSAGGIEGDFENKSWDDFEEDSKN